MLRRCQAKKPNRRAASREGPQRSDQQARFDQFIETFNTQRSHQALNMRYRAELYTPSPRPYSGLPDLEYPFHDRTVTVTRCGHICLGQQKVNLSQAFAGQRVGITQLEERIWLVSFMQFDLGFFDDETCRIESADNPFAAKLSPMSPV
jgi:putative transposase